MSSVWLGARRTPKVRQACDPCHMRKIRCDGGKPCTNCITTDLTCTYLAVPKKKGPKRKRAKINEPKPTRLPYILNQPPPVCLDREDPPSVREILGLKTPSTRPIPDTLAPSIESLLSRVDLDVEIEEGSSEFAPSPSVKEDLFKSCLDSFFTHKYPIMPILDHDQIYNSLAGSRNDPHHYALMAALSAVIVQQPEIIGTGVPGHLAPEATSCPSSGFLIEETKRARQYSDHIENPSLSAVQTSFFLFAALFCMGNDNSAYYYIREAITMLQLLRLHEEITYTNMIDVQYSVHCRRTFWLLFITERAYALQRHRPLTLHRTINLPIIDPGPESTILSGFIDLVSLFQNFDDTFLSSWNLLGTDSPTSTQHLEQLQDFLRFSIPDVSKRTEIQQADLLISRQWLKTMVWQLCVSKGLLSGASANESMSFRYPVTIARDVVLVSRLLPSKAFEANGIGILEKFFDIGCSLADVLSLHPGYLNISGLEVGPQDYLMELVKILGTGPGGKKYLDLLAYKADQCLGVRVRGSLSDGDALDRVFEELSEDNTDSPNEGSSRTTINTNNSDLRAEQWNLDQETGHIYTNHPAPIFPSTTDANSFGYQHAGTQEIDHLSRIEIPGIGTPSFEHPIGYTMLSSRPWEQLSSLDTAAYWDHDVGTGG